MVLVYNVSAQHNIITKRRSVMMARIYCYCRPTSINKWSPDITSSSQNKAKWSWASLQYIASSSWIIPLLLKSTSKLLYVDLNPVEMDLLQHKSINSWKIKCHTQTSRTTTIYSLMVITNIILWLFWGFFYSGCYAVLSNILQKINPIFEYSHHHKM